MKTMLKNSGFSLAEMMIATLLTAMVVSMVAGTLLQSSGRTQTMGRKERAILEINGLVQSLKNYVAEERTEATRPSAPHGCWNFCNPHPATGACSAADCTRGCTNQGLPAGCSALDGNAAGLEHNVSHLLPAEWAAYGATLSYKVRISPATDNLPEVKVTMNWNEP